MTQIPDDPIIACMERTGYPPWMQEEGNGEDSDDEEEEPLSQPAADSSPERGASHLIRR